MAPTSQHTFLADPGLSKIVMNGAQSLIQTLVDCDIDVCFMNPGTSEMHFVAALDSVPRMRSVLCLFEGVVTGAADGYSRMSDKPAATLLHLGPGLSYGLANIHNARRARSSMVNIIGDHATFHKAFDAPLNSDIEALAKPLSDWVRTSNSSDRVSADVSEAIAAAHSGAGKIATLILPADVSWGDCSSPADPTSSLKTIEPDALADNEEKAINVSKLRSASVPGSDKVDDSNIECIARLLCDGRQSVLLLNGIALRERGLVAATKICQKTGAKLLCDTFPGRLQRGAGIPPIHRLNYFAELAADDLKDFHHLILIGTKSPVAFFAYPGKPSNLVPTGCTVHSLASPDDDVIDAIERLVEAVSAQHETPNLEVARRPELPSGKLTSPSIAAAIGHYLPEGAIIVDEGNTEGIFVPQSVAGAPPHDWLFNTGGSIGFGLPVATGAAIACPGRKIICLEGDGSAMYTIQALWTIVRENLDVTVILFANHSYRILNIELERVGATNVGPKAKSMLDLTSPDLDFIALAKGMGIDASRPTGAEAFSKAFEVAMREPGPHLIECIVK